MSRRPLLLGGLVVAGGAGYYLYSAGGDPKVAEKQFEHDAASASAKVKSHLPGSGKEVKTQAELSAEKAGAAFDRSVANAKETTHKVDAKLEQYRANAEKKLDEYRKETGKNLSSAIDKFDKNVEAGASKSQSWIGSWFGGK